MLAGINQTIFLSQWGVPEVKIGLDRLQGSFELDSISLNSVPDEMDNHMVWIYEKRNRIFFFKRGKLISHFRWSEYKERWKNIEEERDDRPLRKTSSLLSTTLSLAA
jgi:hypothetical protein